jgi:hypothetical protein
MTKKAPILLSVALLILLALACDIPSLGGGDDGGDFTGGECEPGTTRLQMDSSASGQITGSSYPDTCTVFCLWVPEGGSRLDISISDFDVDLDMYVDTDLTILQFEDQGQWFSNAFGTDDESVSISSPGGRYYIQVCSYEGIPSGFTIENDYR